MSKVYTYHRYTLEKKLVVELYANSFITKFKDDKRSELISP